MARTAAKAGKPAESEAKAQQAEEAGAKLNELLAANSAAEADEKGEEAAPKKAAKKKVLALNEVEGEIKEGAKVRIGVQSFAEGGGEVIRTLVVPKKWKLVAPASRPGNVHVIDEERPERTLCTLPTNWSQGQIDIAPGSFIWCEPCARRMIAIDKMQQADHDKARAAHEAARQAARVKAVEQAAEEKLLKQQAKQEAAAKAKETEAEAAVTATEAKPDPKPSARKPRRRQPAAKAAAS